LVAGVHREKNDGSLWRPLANPKSELEAIESGHRQVQEQDSRLATLYEVDDPEPVGDLAHDLEITFPLEQASNSLAKQLMVTGQRDRDHVRLALSEPRLIADL